MVCFSISEAGMSPGNFGAKNGEADVDQLGEHGGNIESTSALALTQQRVRVYSAARSRLLSSAFAEPTFHAASNIGDVSESVFKHPEAGALTADSGGAEDVVFVIL